MTGIHPTLVHWFPVDESGAERDLEVDEYLDGGHVLDVPTAGDTVVLNGREWTVVRRIWTLPTPAIGAATPRQACTLHIREDPR